MRLCTVDNGINKLNSEKVKAIKYGLMVHFTKAGGRKIKPMDTVD